MSANRMIAILLIVAGVLGLAYGGFGYTKGTHQAQIGPLDLSVKESQTVNIPVWAGIGAIVAGGLLLVLGARKGWPWPWGDGAGRSGGKTLSGQIKAPPGAALGALLHRPRTAGQVMLTTAPAHHPCHGALDKA